MHLKKDFDRFIFSEQVTTAKKSISRQSDDQNYI